jgi:hypothetical protein
VRQGGGNEEQFSAAGGSRPRRLRKLHVVTDGKRRPDSVQKYDGGGFLGCAEGLALLRPEKMDLGVAEQFLPLPADEGGGDMPLPRGHDREAVHKRDAVAPGDAGQSFPDVRKGVGVQFGADPQRRVPHRKQLGRQQNASARRCGILGCHINRAAVLPDVQDCGVCLHQRQQHRNHLKNSCADPAISGL